MSTIVSCFPPACTWARALLGVAESGGSLWEMMLTGGSFHWLLLFTSVATVLLMADTLYAIRKPRLMPHEFLEAVGKAMAARQYTKALSLCNENRSVASVALTAGLRNARHGTQAVAGAVAKALERERAELARRLSYLAGVAHVAPLVGVLGSVVTTVRILNAGGAQAGAFEDLCFRLAPALLTTITGLVIAVLAASAFYVVRARLARLMAETDAALYELLAPVRETSVAEPEDAGE